MSKSRQGLQKVQQGSCLAVALQPCLKRGHPTKHGVRLAELLPPGLPGGHHFCQEGIGLALLALD